MTSRLPRFETPPVNITKTGSLKPVQAFFNIFTRIL